MKTSLIKPGEQLEDLQCKGLMLIQQPDNYCFTTDSVLLANFVKAKPSDKTIELCSGSGVISILLCAKNNIKHIDIVEIQQDLADMSQRSIKYNDLHDNIVVHNMPLQNCSKTLGQECYDVVVSNPPYYKIVGAPTNESKNITLARHEMAMNLSDLIVESAKLLKYGGKLYLVHRADRVDEIMIELNKHNFGVKLLQFIQPTVNKEAHLVLLQATKGAKQGLRVLPMLYLNNLDGSINTEVAKIYNSNV